MIDELFVAGRLLSGRDPLGGARTDARWSKPGTQVLEGHRAGRWAHMSHRRRAGVAWSCLVAFALLAWAVVVDAWSAATTIRAAVLFALAGGAWAWVEWARKYAHRRGVAQPLAEALAEKLGHAPYVLDPRSWIDVPTDVEDKATRVYLPREKTLTDAQEKAVVKVVAGRLGLVAPTSTAYYQGEAPYLEVRPAPAPRGDVVSTDPDVAATLEELETAAEGRLFFGMAPRDVPNLLDLDTEAPHVAFSMASGAGKSVAVKGLFAQGLRQGGIGLVLDRKVESQLWAMDLPSVRYACSEQEIYDALMWASGEINRRYALVREGAQTGRRPSPEELGPRLFLVVEELNTLEIDLRLWWRDVREKEDPTQCPALPVLGRFLAMGRAARCHAFVVSQKLTCQAIGGPAARENLSTRILGRATTSTWNMLAPECKASGKYPRGSKHRGRVHVVFGDEATPVQVCYFSDEEARAYALGGTVTPFPMGGPRTSGVVAPGDQAAGTVLGHLRSIPGELEDVAPEPEDEAEERISLAEAIELEVVQGFTLDALRKAAQRKGFPDVAGTGPRSAKLYRRAELEAWGAAA